MVPFFKFKKKRKKETNRCIWKKKEKRRRWKSKKLKIYIRSPVKKLKIEKI